MLLMWKILLCFLLLNFDFSHSESCWNNDDDCIIQYAFHSNDLGESTAQHFNLSCGADDNSVFLPLITDILPYVSINGCHTFFLGGYGTASYGLSMIPHCNSLLQLTLERFHDDDLQQLNCDSNETLKMEILNLRHNDIGILGPQAFVYLKQLRELNLESNSLRHLDVNLFEDLFELQRISIKQEPLLTFKEKDAQLLQQTQLRDIHLVSLKRLTPLLLQQLPMSLNEIHVSHTFIETEAVVLINPQLLQKVSLISCSLNSFELQDDYTSISELNLSGNTLKTFHFITPSSAESGLMNLDLSDNQLTHLPFEWLTALKNLRHLRLHHNLFKTLSLFQLMSLPCNYIDLRENQLIALRDAALKTNRQDEFIKIIQIDKNPWNCMWLLEFAQSYPEKFRIFQYEKFISQINVNGLTCHPEEQSIKPQETNDNEADVDSKMPLSNAIPTVRPTAAHIVNASSYTMPHGWDFKRSQRDEALIIVFMLPLGIAFLFLLLYMWIYCQKLFHWSYYSNLPIIGNHHFGHHHASADRADVVRQLPPHMNGGCASSCEDYEIPLNGLTSVCNCHASGAEETGDVKCRKKLHVTYEPLPDEQAYKIYEEILGGDESKIVMEDGMTPHPFYDQLSYVQKTPESNK